MNKPREFWIMPLSEFGPDISSNPKDHCMNAEVFRIPVDSGAIHVREVLPISWDKVWASIKMTSKPDLIVQEYIQQLVERALKGEL